jgi:tetratricopeptide (TPR) repeat protein
LAQALAARPDQVVLLDRLGKLLEQQGASRLGEAIGYYQAARGQRRLLGITLSKALIRAGRPAQAGEVMQDLVRQQPDNPAKWFYLGLVLDGGQKYGEAEAAYRKALGLQPAFVAAHVNLGVTLVHQGRPGEGEAACRRAVGLQPGLAEAHAALGCALDHQGKYREAEAASRRAVGLKPDLAEAHATLGSALVQQGKPGAGEAACRRAIALKPGLVAAHTSLGAALLDQRRPREAEAACRQAIALQPNIAEAHYNLGTALYHQGKVGEAQASLRQAIDLKPAYAEAHFNLGLVLMDQAQFDEAASALKRAGELFPAAHPRRELAQQLQRQCARYAVLDARLPAVLAGKEKPAEAAERIEFAQLCRLKKLCAAAAQFYAAAFTADPKLAEAAPAGHRYHAARAAALAGCGQGRDAGELDDPGRARWRRQALKWLRQDLAWWGRALDSGNAQARADVRGRLQFWQTDGDLACLRDPSALAGLPPDERKECVTLWDEVAAVLRRSQTTR